MLDYLPVLLSAKTITIILAKHVEVCAFIQPSVHDVLAAVHL